MSRSVVYEIQRIIASGEDVTVGNCGGSYNVKWDAEVRDFLVQEIEKVNTLTVHEMKQKLVAHFGDTKPDISERTIANRLEGVDLLQ